MIHLFYFMVRKPSMDEGEFHRYWREVHGPIVEKIPELKRYVQSHRISFPRQNSPYDGAAEVWLDHVGVMETLRYSAEYLKGPLADEPNFIDMSRVEWLVTTDHVILDGPKTPHMVKAIFQVKRKPGTSLSDFRQYWLEVNGPIICKLPGLRRYVESYTLDAAYAYAEPRWDGVVQIWADDSAALQKLMTLKDFREVALADAGKFIDMTSLSGFVAQEDQVINSA